MAHSDNQSNHEIDFRWGKKRGVGGAKRDIQFYESFVLEGINYSLYDCVYLFKKPEDEPFIGKLLKIWERPNHKKQVKILWFFRPCEIKSYLGDHAPLENEIFLACGEGIGLSNVNPLEAIAGKCIVICMSKDERNREPSNGELEMSDYVFSRTFNVKSCSISEKFQDKIDGIEVKFLFNKEVTNPSGLSGFKSKDVHGSSQKAVASTESNSDRISDKKVDNKALDLPNSSGMVNPIGEKHAKKGEFLDGLQAEVALGKDNNPENQVGDNSLLLEDKDSDSIDVKRPIEHSEARRCCESLLSAK